MRPIDANSLLEKWSEAPKCYATYVLLTDIQRSIEEEPTVDPTVHAEWVTMAQIEKTMYNKCSHCGKIFPVENQGNPYNYCPNCGAKMDEE